MVSVPGTGFIRDGSLPGYWLLPSRLCGKEELLPGNTCHGKLPQAEGVGVDEKIWILYKIKIKLKAITKRFLPLPPVITRTSGLLAPNSSSSCL